MLKPNTLTNIRYHIGFFLLLVALLLPACQSQSTVQSYGNIQGSDHALFSIPEDFNLLFVNGKKHNQPLISGRTRLQLAPGKYHFVVEYDNFWVNELGDDDRITSQAVLISFEAEAGKHYQLQFPSPKDIQQAKHYAKSPQVSIIEKTSGTTIDSTVKYQLTEDILNARLKELTNIPMAGGNNETSNKSKNTAAGSDKAMEMLQYWWNQAGETQKRAFKHWLEQHP